jgi:hypothetical protein
VYLRVGTASSDVTTVYDSMAVRLALIQDTTFKDTILWGAHYHLLKRGLKQVFFQKSFSVYGADSVGTWVRFPLSGEFSYNPNANLVVELSRGSQVRAKGINWMTTRGCTGCTGGGSASDSLYGYGYPTNVQADIGFNDATGAVGGLVNLKGFYTYPNPSQGLFTVGFEPWGSNAVTVKVSLTDMAGRQVWQRSYEGVRADLFTANVDVRGRPKGVYLLRVQAGEAQALQRVVLE